MCSRQCPVFNFTRRLSLRSASHESESDAAISHRRRCAVLQHSTIVDSTINSRVQYIAQCSALVPGGSWELFQATSLMQMEVDKNPALEVRPAAGYFGAVSFSFPISACL